MPDETQSRGLDFPNFEGTLEFQGKTVSVFGSIRVQDDGAIVYDLEPVPITGDTVWLLEATSVQGRVIPPFKFRGRTSAKIDLESDRFYISSQTTSSDSEGRQFAFAGDILGLEVIYRELPAVNTGVVVRYFLTGFKCFGAPTAVTPLGRVTLLGSNRITNPDLLSGTLNIVAEGEPRPLQEWLADCDKMAAKILDIMSLAEGRFFRWSARQIDDNTDHLRISCAGPRATGGYQDGVFPYLNLQPALDLAITRYTDDLCKETGMPVALEWFVHHPDYMELQLLAAITALEHLVAVYVGGKGKPPIVKPSFFEDLLAKTKALWGPICDLSEEKKKTENKEELDALESTIKARKRLTDKLDHLNDGSFQDQLERMTAEYQVPLAGLEMERVKDAIRARNKVVHSGLYRKKKSSDPALHEHVAVLREFLVRLFLKKLGYEGQYWSLLEARWREFPA